MEKPTQKELTEEFERAFNACKPTPKETVHLKLEVEKDEVGSYHVLVYADRNDEPVEIDDLFISARKYDYQDVLRDITTMRYVHSDEDYLKIQVVKVIAEHEFFKAEI